MALVVVHRLAIAQMLAQCAYCRAPGRGRIDLSDIDRYLESLTK